ncbi:efflux RND transporter permease subunit [Sinomonas sp. ASV322]|uniref:efflux RND transporter permease subunit n=1 Tax=Sinomonas sp. ASV322 TaxID=3041920 RepID=UPI0027DB3BED|nr:efflux RND transporter permease subunit [Sinomonas sp. ASV322]MDQ4502150.1 efflux RND transporter permease subunit [Sinomonas sp. ASV322]
MFRLASLSMSNKALIALITLFAAVFGVITAGSLKQELIPSIEFPQLTVVTSMAGASPDVVDKQVGQPLEKALQAVEGLESSSSTSRTGVSTIRLSFAYGTNLDRARNQIDRAISTAKQQLPSGVQPNTLAGSISDFPIVFIAASSDKGLSELEGQLVQQAVPTLSKIEGVRGVDITGGATRHIQIQPDPAAMGARGVDVAAIRTALQNNGSLVPVGTITDQGRTLSLQAGSPIDSTDTIKGLPVAGAKQPTKIGDVASVAIQDDTATSITRTDGKLTLALSVTKKPEGDTVAISHAVRDALPGLESSLGSNAKLTTVFDQAPFIEKSIKDLTTEGLLGLGFAVLTILVFLLSVRSTLVTAVSIPLSLLITFIGLFAAHYSLNILTLGALTIAIGRVVDDSIVVIENIKRHLSYGEEKTTAILAAVREVAAAVTASTLTTVAVFLPIAFVGNLAGELFRPFALTVTIALLASLAVALTIVPVLAYWFLGHKSSGAANRAGVEAEAHVKERKSALQRGYLPVLRATQKHPVWTVVAGVLVLVATFAMTPLLATNLLGRSGENSFTVTQKLPPGTSLDATSTAAAKVEAALRGTEGVQTVQVTIGNSTTGFSAFVSSGASNASFTVITDGSADQAAVQQRARNAVAGLSGAGTVTVSDQQGGFGTSSTVDVTVKAPDSATLGRANDAVVGALKDVPGATGVTSNLAAAQPIVQVSVDRAKAVAAGLNEQQVGALLAATVSPVPAGTVRIDTTDYPVLIGKGTQFSSVDSVRGMPLPGQPGLTLGAIASVTAVDVPVTVTSTSGQRTATVSVMPGDTNLGSVSAEVQKRIAGLALDGGATASVGGAASQQAESFKQLGLALLAAIAIVYVVMVAAFKSLLQPLVLLVSIPFAATGAIGLLLATRIPLGLPALIGLLMLVGIVVTNAIVLIDLINQYRRPRGRRPALPLEDAIEQGARQRLRPILMTALATIFALTPMALGLTGGGGFIAQPLAVVVIGGLVSSTVLTLVLVPVLYRLVEGRLERRRLLRDLTRRPAPAAATNDDDDDAGDWTTGAVPKVTGRRAAKD